MMDSQENALNQSTLEEEKAIEQPVVENVETAPVEEAPVIETAVEEKKVYTTKQEVVDRLKDIAAGEDAPQKEEIDLLKTLFYKFHNAEREAQQKEYLDAGGDPETYQVVPDELEETFKAEMSLIREKRQQAFQKLEEERQQNLTKKLEIIEKIKGMATSPDEANKSYQEFKTLQQEWKEIGAVPAERSTEVWRSYQHIVEQFYDLLKLNIEAREYDFKKNLEMKTAICEAAEKLGEEKDVVSAFHQLQELHNQFREIGPVARELREEVWNRFKAASTVINKAHQQHFETLRAGEEENLTKKTALCEQAEAINAEEHTSATQWEEHTKKMIELQSEWKTIGFAPQKMNVKIFERFRAACDQFFTAKAEYFKAVKERFAENTAKKQALVEKARELSESTEWRSAGDKLIALQKEWKEIGAVPKKVGDQLWADFRAACDKFFDARNAANAGTRGAEKENLEKKRSVVERLKALAEEVAEDLQDKIKELQEEYNQIGHVPFKDKDKLYKEYHEALDTVYGKLRAEGRSRRMDSFRQGLKNVARRGEDALDNERARLMRSYEVLKQEIQTYENNLGFLSAASKKGNALVDEITRKVEKLKGDLQLTKEKIKAIDASKEEEEQ